MEKEFSIHYKWLNPPGEEVELRVQKPGLIKKA
jgi:hypothetical protein